MKIKIENNSLNKFIFTTNKKMKNFKFNGKIEGEYIDYHESGNIWIKCYFKNDIKEGDFIEYYESGKISCKYYCKNGNIEWEFIRYYDNGIFIINVYIKMIK